MTTETTIIKNIRVCYACGDNKTSIGKNGVRYWYSNKPIGWLCRRCYDEIIHTRQWTPYRLRFKGERIYVNRQPRIGVCNWCRAVIGQINAQSGKLCRLTQMHHEQYYKEDPLKDTIELCVICHNR